MRRALAFACLIGATPVVAQDVQNPGAPATSISTTVLLPLPANSRQFPSGRFTASHSFGSLSLHGGAVHLTPVGSGLWAGVGGVQLDLLDGRFDVSPFIDAGFGQVVQKATVGAVPRLAELTSWSFGAGAGVELEWRVRPQVGLTGTAGYWHFAPGEDLDPVAGAFAGGGLRFGLPFGGGETVPPPPVLANGPILIRVEEPAAWATGGTRGIRAVAKNSIRVVGTARDPSGVAIREVRLNGQLAALRPMDSAGGLARFVGFVPVTEETDGVEISAVALDGRRTSASFTVTPTVPRVSDAGAQAAAARSAAGVEGKRFAVIIGVSDYADPEIPDLDYADDDALAFYEFLRSERAGLGGIPEENIQLLVNEDATFRNMRGALYTFLEQATEDDVVFIYIAAHGTPNPNRPDDLFILPFDAEARDIAGTGLAMGHVNEAIQKLYARHTVLLTDACHSGGIGMGSFATRAAPGGETLNAINRAFLQDLQATQSGLAILTASEARQLSREGEQWGGGHGVFTWYLLQGLEGKADEDGDQIVRLGELLEYVRDGVRRETSNGQIPAFGSNAFDRFMPMAIVPDEQ